ncbi:MAG: NAD(P)-binding domain-containing protein [Thiolinea sp.]
MIKADVVITMLSDSTAVHELLFGQAITVAMQPGACLIDCEFHQAAGSPQSRSRLQAMGLKHLDAPVSGGTKGAEAGTLAIMAGDDAAVFEQVKPVLEAMGRPVSVGPDGAGQLAKLANQAIVAVTIGVVARRCCWRKRVGPIRPRSGRRLRAVLLIPSSCSSMARERMTTGNFTPGEPVKIPAERSEQCAGGSRAL